MSILLPGLIVGLIMAIIFFFAIAKKGCFHPLNGLGLVFLIFLSNMITMMWTEKASEKILKPRYVEGAPILFKNLRGDCMKIIDIPDMNLAVVRQRDVDVIISNPPRLLSLLPYGAKFSVDTKNGELMLSKNIPETPP